MKLGFVSAPPAEDRIKFAQEAGFDGIEVVLGRGAGGKEYLVTTDNARKVKGCLDQYGMKALTLQLSEDYSANAHPFELMKTSIQAAEIVGTKIVTVNAWVPKGLKLEEQFEYYRKEWTEFAEMAEDKGVRIAIENCPHGGRNLGNCPESFRRMFELVPSKAIGLEFDPSHFIFQFMDYLSAIREFGDRVYAFHAKDTQILHNKLDRVGIYGDQFFDLAYGQGWWQFRMPGYGDADWKAIFVALSDIKYDGDIIIEHEDPTYEGNEGLRRGSKFLRQYILEEEGFRL